VLVKGPPFKEECVIRKRGKGTGMRAKRRRADFSTGDDDDDEDELIVVSEQSAEELVLRARIDETIG